ncbi:roadblock/LC7 domain-containing protein [Marinicella sp. W31]|uniref:roadblock/LC7 domain-containing protein n=1 Tax=Marinicella sp. W31 TaxID=3023713 RepID=UPI0037568BA6
MDKALRDLFKKAEVKFSDLHMLALTTADGFPICTRMSVQLQAVEEEKVAAISSSLLALSHSAARQVTASNLISTNIETSQANMFLVKTSYQNQKAVLCTVTGLKQNFGHARYFTHQLAKVIRNQ